jgi:hypothetical protein
MTHGRKTRYHDPDRSGSLSHALRQWQELLADGRDALPQRVVFTLACGSESRANRIAGFLRRRLTCDALVVQRVAGGPRDTWQIEGSTRPAVTTLTSLESTFGWLQGAARNHQAVLVEIGFAPAV